MRICFLGDAAAHHLRRWSRYFAGRGHDVHVISFNANILDGYDGIHVHIVPKKFPKETRRARFLSVVPQITAIKKILNFVRPDVLHSHSAGGYAWLGMLSGHHPFIITPWGNDVLLDIRNSRLERFLTKRALRQTDAITCDGENMKEALVELGIDPHKIHLITFGVDIRRFRPKDKVQAVAGANPPSPPSPLVLSTRILTPVHDVETLVRAVPLVLQKAPDAIFIFAGAGSLKASLENLAKTLGVDSSTKFVGMLSESDMIQVLQSADLYVSTSLSESGLAASTAEAMACELPIINTDTGDIRLWIEDGQGGFIVPPRDPVLLAEKIIYLLQHEAVRTAFGRRNRAAIELRNNYYVEMEKTEHLYLQASEAWNRRTER